MTPSSSVFPNTSDFAYAFFQESVRHLEDARHLCQADRHAALITSSMKASELGAKAALILENAMGLWGQMFTTHKPLTDIENHAVLKRLNAALKRHRSDGSDISLDIRSLESLEPTAFVKNLDGSPNTEYPFLVRSAGGTEMELRSPADDFFSSDSLKYYRLSHELLVALPMLYPAMSVWNIHLPQTL